MKLSSGHDIASDGGLVKPSRDYLTRTVTFKSQACKPATGMEGGLGSGCEYTEQGQIGAIAGRKRHWLGDFNPE